MLVVSVGYPIPNLSEMGPSNQLSDVPNPKKNMVYGTLMLELTITSPYVHSRVDSNTYTMGVPIHVRR
jgi:hypothetical protein